MPQLPLTGATAMNVNVLMEYAMQFCLQKHVTSCQTAVVKDIMNHFDESQQEHMVASKNPQQRQIWSRQCTRLCKSAHPRRHISACDNAGNVGKSGRNMLWEPLFIAGCDHAASWE